MAKKRSYPNIQWRDGVAQLEVTVRGQRIRESLHTSNFNEAVEHRDKRIAELKKGVIAESATWHTPGAAPVGYASVREYADQEIDRARARGCEANTVRWTYEHPWVHLCAAFPTVELITNETVATYYYARLKAGHRHVSVKRDIPYLRGAAKWGRRLHPELEIVDWEVPRKKKGGDKGNQAGEPKPVEVVRRWFAALKPERQAQAALLMCSGIRLGEMAKVKPEWIEPVAGSHVSLLRLPAWATKDRRARAIGLPRNVAALVREHFPTAANPRKHFNTVAKAVGYGDTISPRDLRHTLKVQVSRHEPIAVQLVMGHRHLEGTAGDMYQHLTDEDCIRVAQVVSRIFWPTHMGTHSASFAENLKCLKVPQNGRGDAI